MNFAGLMLVSAAIYFDLLAIAEAIDKRLNK